MGPDEWPPVAVVVPDDIRELEADVAAYYRERRRAGRRTRWDRILLTHRWARYGLSGPVVVIVLVLVGFVGSLMALFPPSSPHLAESAQLASTSVAPGRLGGLLPDVRLDVTGSQQPARGLRPALLFIVPSGCDCASVVHSLVTQTVQYSLRLVLVTDGLPSDQLAKLRDASLGRAELALDKAAAMRAVYGTDTLVFVRADGVVRALVRHPTATARYELPLAQLATAPGQTTALSSAA